jgi:hypothetical protein
MGTPRVWGGGGRRHALGGGTRPMVKFIQASSTEEGKTPPVHIFIGQKIWEGGGGRHAFEGEGGGRHALGGGHAPW